MLRRTVTTVAALLTVTTAFAAGVLVSDARSGEGPAYRLTAAGLDSGLSCDRLRQWYVGHGLDQVTAWGWQEPMMYDGTVPLAGAVADDASGTARSAPLDTQTSSSTGTNVQEVGVDEPDLVKTNGRLLVRISDGSLKTDDVSGAEPRRLGVAPLEGMVDPELLLSGDRAVVIGTGAGDPGAGTPFVAPQVRTRVLIFDLSDPSHPVLVDTRAYDGSLVTARQVGSSVRLVLDGGLPALDFVHPSSTVTQAEALARNRQVVRDSTVDDWLPHVTTYTDGQASSVPLLDCAGVAIPETFEGLGTLTVVGFDAADPSAAHATALTTASETAYMSPTHLYVATSPWANGWRGFGPLVAPDQSEPTRIYGFDLAGASATYVGMGSVSGTVAGSWSMDEHDGVLRVATTADATSPSTSVVMLRPESGRLLDVGQLDGLGVGQRLKSVRWFDDIAVLVTFRQTDPFYVVDVTDPTDPHVLGELHLPGWSSYLHPVGSHLVLGLGQTSPREITIEPPKPLPTRPVPVPPKPAPEVPGTPDATIIPVPVDPTPWPQPMVPVQRAKATLFDISDVTHPRAEGTVSYPDGSQAMAGLDPHQVTWLPDRDTLLTVIGSGYSGAPGGSSDAWLSVLTVQDGTLVDRLVPLPTGVPVNDVRTVPVDGDRVVLVAGDSVRFVAL